MGWITQILRWRRPLPAPIRWLAATTLFGIAFAIRWSLGPLFGAAPFVSFYPAILVAAVMFGWQEAVFVLVLSLSAGLRFFLPSDRSLLPVGWALVGGLNIAIIIALKTLAERLAEANERQRVLFAELQHRVANTLQIAAGKLESIRRTLSSSPNECANMMDEAISRMSASAEMHRRLHDPSLFNIGREAMLREVVSTTADQQSVTLDLRVRGTRPLTGSEKRHRDAGHGGCEQFGEACLSAAPRLALAGRAVGAPRKSRGAMRQR